MQTKTVNVALALYYWTREYGSGRIQWLGYPKTNLLHPKHGLGMVKESCKELTPADKVQKIYMSMLATAWFKHAKILEMECFHADWPWMDKKHALRLCGVLIQNRGDYNAWLIVATQHVKKCLQDDKLSHEYNFTKVAESA